MYGRLKMYGALTTPHVTGAAVTNATRRLNSTLPPTISAFRRSPRRQAVTLASATNTRIRMTVVCVTSCHGLGTPAGTVTASPRNCICCKGNIVR